MQEDEMMDATHPHQQSSWTVQEDAINKARTR